MPRPETEKPKTLPYEGVNYQVVKVGGYGISRGLDSIIEAVDGPHKGQRYYADIRQGIDRIKSEVNPENNEQKEE